MASGCPCIVADTGGLREVVPAGERVGLRFNGGDAEHLGVMIERLLVDVELRDRLVTEASEHVLSFDWSDVAQRTTSVYGDLIPRRADEQGESDEMLEGLMQDDFQLTLQHPLHRMRSVHPGAEVVTLTDKGTVTASYGEVAERVDRLARVLGRLGVEQGDRVGTFAWNNQRHLELYMAVPCVGAVLHTLNVRLFAEQLTYIVNHAEDGVIFVDDSLVPILQELAPTLLQACATTSSWAMATAGSLPDALRYEELLEEAGPGRFEYPDIDERQAAALCYTSGTTGNPKGVLYSHRSISLALDRVADEGRARPLPARPGAPGRADVPRQRLGHSPRRGARRRRPDDARSLSPSRASGEADRGRAPHDHGLRAHYLLRSAALRRRSRCRPLLAEQRRLWRVGGPAPADAGFRGAPRVSTSFKHGV